MQSSAATPSSVLDTVLAGGRGGMLRVDGRLSKVSVWVAPRPNRTRFRIAQRPVYVILSLVVFILKMSQMIIIVRIPLSVPIYVCNMSRMRNPSLPAVQSDFQKLLLLNARSYRKTKYTNR